MTHVSDSDKSAYNSAVQFMFELSDIRRKLHVSRWNEDLKLRYDLLVSYYMALSARMRKNKALLKKHEEFYQELTKELSNVLKYRRRRRSVPTNIFILLDQWEKALRQDEDALGLLVPDKSDPAFALGGQMF